MSKDNPNSHKPPVPMPPPPRATSHEAEALNRIADALERLADVYLYVNDPEGEEGPAPSNLPDGFRGMR